MKIKQETFRSWINWLGILLAAHLVALLLFSIALSGNCATMEYEEKTGLANGTTLIFSLVYIPLFLLLYYKILFSFADTQRKFRTLWREFDGSLLRFWYRHHFKDVLCKLALFAILQLPFVLSYATLGFSYIRPTAIARFFVMDAGFFVITESALWGFLLNTLYFAVFHIGIHLAFYAALARDSGK